MTQDTNTFDNLRRTILHQPVIRRDIRLALRRIDNQRGDFIAAAAQFCAGRETRAAKARDAELMNSLNQFFTRTILVIVPAVA